MAVSVMSSGELQEKEEEKTGKGFCRANSDVKCLNFGLLAVVFVLFSFTGLALCDEVTKIFINGQF